LDNYLLYADVDDEYDLGYYFIHEAGVYDLGGMGSLANYIDYKAFGRDISFDSNGDFTSLGWLEVS
jgi:hypothetical protein